MPVAAPECEPAVLPGVKTASPAPRTMRPWNVVLLNDEDHTYDYVIEMLQAVFGHSVELAFLFAVEVDTTGRVIVDTTTKERAELKQEQIHAYGPDPLIPSCAGSMTAIIEPAE